METVKDFVFLGSKITADGDCRHEIKRCLLFGRKAITNLDSILKTRDITLLTKVCIVKAMFFPVVMYGCESWTIKKAEHWINAFKLWCWRRLESPLNCKEVKPVNPKGNQPWIFIATPHQKLYPEGKMQTLLKTSLVPSLWRTGLLTLPQMEQANILSQS